MDSGQIMGGVGVVVSVATAIIAAVNHKRCKSKCCGRDASVSIDIENTTPPKEKPPAITIPADAAK